MKPRAVSSFVKKIAAAKKLERKQRAANRYEYRFSDDAAASKTYFKPSPKARPRKLSEDYSAY
jgi:hypothetical protein